MANHNPSELTNEQQDQLQAVHNKLFKDKLPISSLGLSETPLINRILILPDPVAAVTRSGIVVPDTAKERPEVGTVVAIGPGRISEHGVLIPVSVKVGDRVKYGKWAGSWVEDEDTKIMLLLTLDTDCLTQKSGPDYLTA